MGVTPWACFAVLCGLCANVSLFSQADSFSQSSQRTAKLAALGRFLRRDAHRGFRYGGEKMNNRAYATILILLFVASMILTPRAASREPVRARHGMVASTSEIASRVGVEVMQRGGNAIDAAVAVGLALAVTWPSAGNIGGGGFMMIRRANGDTEIIDYRERAPLAGSRDMYLDKVG